MLVSCANCGAPLDVKPQSRLAACRYCKAKNEVGALRTISPQTPAGWKPPPVWTPPPGMAAPPQPLRYHRAVGAIVAAAVVLPLVLMGVGIAFAVGGAARATRGIVGSGGEAAEDWDGKSAFRCGGNDRAKLVGKTVKDAVGPLVIAETNCELTLVDCDLEAPTVLEAAGNARVRVERGRIAGTAEGIPAASAKGNAHIVFEGTRVQSKGLAFEATENAEIDARRARVEGAGRSSGNADVMGAPAPVTPKAESTGNAVRTR